MMTIPSFVVNSTYIGAENLPCQRACIRPGMERSSTARSQPSIQTPTVCNAYSPFPQICFPAQNGFSSSTCHSLTASGHAVSHNFYWVPGTLTTFNWENTDYTHTPAARHEDLTALAHLPPAQIEAHAEIENNAHGREIYVHLANHSKALAFQLRAAARTSSRGLIAPVLWSDNWIELVPGESTTLTARLPEGEANTPVVQIDGWNVAPISLTPTAAVAAR